MIGDIIDPVERLLAFAVERHAIFWRRNQGCQKPWTNDPILRAYRFCNVYRENDTVTKWIKDHWRDPHSTDDHLWFAMVIARFVNKPETLALLGYPVPWNRPRFLQIMRTLKDEKKTAYGGAYMIRAASGEPGKPKALYQADEVFDPLWQNRGVLRPKIGDTLNSYHMLLGQFHGLGSFMAAQVVADLKYVEPLAGASDWWTFAASGPGSRRGLNRALGRPVKAPWTEEDWRFELSGLRAVLGPKWERHDMARPHAQDLQNVLCEFDKMERVRLGEGRPKQRYAGV